ncbi:MAG: hypothetical protein H7095_06870 [Pseudopedobacter sp.]|nr:hypothetical protein [Deinococcales bacterium]
MKEPFGGGERLLLEPQWAGSELLECSSLHPLLFPKFILGKNFPLLFLRSKTVTSETRRPYP